MSSSSGGSGGGGATSNSNSSSSRFDQILDSIIKPFKFFHHPASSVTGKGHHHLETELEVAIAAQEQKIFSLQTLMAATRKFHQENLLGQGGFGPVYKGKLKDGREIAVKKLSRASTQGKREFINEARLLSRVQHRNVVNLVGYCAEGVEKLLVYEYIVNESLDKLLFDDERRHELDWLKRFGVIVGVARGLLYLHQDAHCIIIHRDIKAGNILLDERWKPKISDFGMARLFPEDQTHVHTRVAGTNGYMAPEYLMHGQLSDKADVFSFGMVVLELISGKKNSSFVPLPEAKSLAEWAWKLHKSHRSLEMMDPALASSATPEQIQYCTHIGLLCVQADPKMRPGMNRVVNLLSKKPGNLDEPTKPGFPGSRYRPRRSERGSSSYGVFTASQSADASSSSNSSTARTFSSVTSNQAGCEMPSGIDTSSTTKLSNSRTKVSGTSSLTQPSTFGSRATRIEPLSPEHSGGSGSYSAGPSTSTSRTRSDPELTTHIGDAVDPIELSISNKISSDPLSLVPT